jgi:hypothetical protein
LRSGKIKLEELDISNLAAEQKLWVDRGRKAVPKAK